MRLGQLARKLSLRPSQLVDFLSTKQIHLEEGSNARLKDEHVTAIVTYFAPERFQEIVAQTKEDSDSHREIILVEKTPEMVTPEPEEIQEKIEVVTEDLKPEEPQDVELIKAPKVELSGLKVLGKIELPELKKKEPVSPSEETETKDSEEKIKSRPATKRNFRTDRQANQKEWRNPIAMQREREEREALEKRKEALEREKERKRMHYLSKIKTEQPTKAIRVYDEPDEKEIKTIAAPPKTLWGKFIKWLNN
ncbi:MAG: hypothetical protein JNM78_16655 [Cyclobacteriaceae bacterium]|nr:hypothetical protein [Cyclobacteriaceae bacterium]